MGERQSDRVLVADEQREAGSDEISWDAEEEEAIRTYPSVNLAIVTLSLE